MGRVAMDASPDAVAALRKAGLERDPMKDLNGFYAKDYSGHYLRGIVGCPFGWVALATVIDPLGNAKRNWRSPFFDDPIACLAHALVEDWGGVVTSPVLTGKLGIIEDVRIIKG